MTQAGPALKQSSNEEAAAHASGLSCGASARPVGRLPVSVATCGHRCRGRGCTASIAPTGPPRTARLQVLTEVRRMSLATLKGPVACRSWDRMPTFRGWCNVFSIWPKVGNALVSRAHPFGRPGDRFGPYLRSTTWHPTSNLSSTWLGGPRTATYGANVSDGSVTGVLAHGDLSASRPWILRSTLAILVRFMTG